MILKGDLKGFQENSETFFKSICHDLTPANLKARRDKSYAHFFLTTFNTYIALIRMRSKRFTSIVLQYDLEI